MCTQCRGEPLVGMLPMRTQDRGTSQRTQQQRDSGVAQKGCPEDQQAPDREQAAQDTGKPESGQHETQRQAACVTHEEPGRGPVPAEEPSGGSAGKRQEQGQICSSTRSHGEKSACETDECSL